MTELASFHDVRFPTAVSFGATGGPERKVEIVTLASGRERRNARFAHSRRTFDAGTGLRSLTDLHEVVAFFEARRGPLHAFRFRDPFDMKSCRADLMPGAADQELGSGDGTRTRFALVKTYGSGADAYLRPIRKPVQGTLLVAPAGEALSDDQFSFVDATGEVVLEAPPDPGVQVTAGYEFDIAARFATERLDVSLESFAAGRIPFIALVEVMT
jgi:uncharacterized protein (TIGR02217 family)